MTGKRTFGLFTCSGYAFLCRSISMFALFISIAINIASSGAQQAITAESGLTIIDLAIGDGQDAEYGDIVAIHFQGWLDEQGQAGKMFASSRDNGEPLAFLLGTDKVLNAWNQAVRGMKVGGIRRVLVPASQGLGESGAEGFVPPDADIIFEIELTEIRRKEHAPLRSDFP